MKYPIIIGSHPGSKFLQNCLDSLQGMECMVIVNDGYEMGKIRTAYFSTMFDEFCFFPDSVEFKQPEWIKGMFETTRGHSVSFCQCPCIFGSYMGKYRRSVLNRVHLAPTPTKVEAVNAERSFSDTYCTIERPTAWFTDLSDNDRFEESFGRRNMVIENDFLIKRKGTFNMAIAEAIDAR